MEKRNEKPLFFVFTCIKDGREYIQKLFDSMLLQTKKNFVHFIYEDGSKEPINDLMLNYKNKVNKLDNKYEVVYEYNKTNIGLNAATKHCIEKCNLPFFIWIDCDNWIDEFFFEELESFINNNPNGCIYSSYPIRTRNMSNTFYSPFEDKYNLNRMYYNNKTSLLVASLYIHSFFAVDIKEYERMNPDNFFINNKNVPPDVQVIYHMSFSDKRHYLVSKAIGFQLMRLGSESDSIHDYFPLESFFVENYKNKYKKTVIIDSLIKLRHIILEFRKTNYSLKFLMLILKKRFYLRKCSIPIRIGYLERNDLYYLLLFPFLFTLSKIRKGLKK